jgi:hypothetical protein
VDLLLPHAPLHECLPFIVLLLPYLSHDETLTLRSTVRELLDLDHGRIQLQLPNQDESIVQESVANAGNLQQSPPRAIRVVSASVAPGGRSIEDVELMNLPTIYAEMFSNDMDKILFVRLVRAMIDIVEKSQQVSFSQIHSVPALNLSKFHFFFLLATPQCFCFS